MSNLVFKTDVGELVWGTRRFACVSGPHGKGQMPAGRYDVRVRHVVTGARLSSSYRDPETGDAWFIPLEPTFSTPRDGFGIHPDGNIEGTLGCIGLKGEDAAEFWAEWKRTSISARPTSLLVS